MDSIEVAVDSNLQYHCGVIPQTAGRMWNNAGKTQFL
jgi:hypothetical protein